MNNIETMKLALEALEFNVGEIGFTEVEKKALTALRQAIEQAQQAEPVVMKFKIYKPTVPDPMRQDINDALLPWVYDQSRGSGFVASMWVTPVATLPPPRQPLTDEMTKQMKERCDSMEMRGAFVDGWLSAEAAHGIKEKNT